MNAMEVHSFLGFPYYYHQFMKDYGKVAWPLYNLIAGDNTNYKNYKVAWNLDCKEAF